MIPRQREVSDHYRKRLVLIVQSALVIADLPFLIMGLVVTIFTWRAHMMWDLIRKNMQYYAGDDDAPNVRKAVTIHFFMFFVNIPFFIMFIVLVATLYRLPRTIRNLKDVRSRTSYDELTQKDDTFSRWTFICLSVFHFIAFQKAS
jgi:hypothetical protein